MGFALFIRLLVSVLIESASDRKWLLNVFVIMFLYY